MASGVRFVRIVFTGNTSGLQAAIGASSVGLKKFQLAVAGAVAGIGVAVKNAAEFDKTIRLAGTTAGASAAQMKSLSESALKVGSSSMFGAQGAADAMLELAKAGLSVAEINQGALAGTMTLAAAGGIELGDAATYVSNAMNAFNLQATDASAIAAAFAGGANASTASVESLGTALGQVGPGAVNAGLSLQETVAALAAFDQAGIKGSDAGTSLKTMLARLVPASGEAADEMKRLGLDFTDATGSFLPLRDVAEQLKTAFAGLSEEQRSQALTTIFGSDATRGASVLMKEGAKGIEAYTKATSDLTAAQKLQKEQEAGASGALRAFASAVESLQIAFALHLLPGITAAVQGLTRFVGFVASKVDPVMSGLGRIFREEVQPRLVELADFATNRVAPALEGMWEHAQPLVDAAVDAFTAVGRAVGDLAADIRDAGPGLRDLVAALSPVLAPFAAVAIVAFDLAQTLAGPLSDAIGAVAGVLADFGSFLRDHSTVVGSLAAAVGGLALGLLAVKGATAAWAAVTAVATFVTGGWVGAFWALNAAMSANPIGIVVVLVAGLAAGLVYAWKKSETFRDIVIGAWNTIVSAVGSAVKGLVSFYGGYVDLILLGFQKILEGLGHIPKWLGGGAFDTAAEAIRGLRDTISAGVDAINREVDRIVTDVQINVRLNFQESINPNVVGQGAAQQNEAAADKAWQRAPENIEAANKARARKAGEDAGKKLSDTLSKGLASTLSAGGASLGGGAAAALGGGKSSKTKAAAKKTGQDILSAFLTGLSSKFPAVDASLREWSESLPVRLGHGLDAVVARAEKNMTRLQKAIDANSASLGKARDRLTDAKSRLADYAKEVRGAVNALGDLGSHGGGTFEIVRDRLRATLVNARDFAATMKRLTAAGLSDTALQQLVAAGPGLATQTGRAILAGGKAGIAEINRMQTELDKVAKATATATANELFAAGVRQAEGVLAGLKSKQKVLEAQMRKAGDALVDAVLKGLKLKVTGAGVRIAGKRALGGPVTAGRSYLVGEQGMELFTPRTSGAITPLGGDGGSMSVNIYATGPTLQDIVRVEVRESHRRLKTASLAGARRAF